MIITPVGASVLVTKPCRSASISLAYPPRAASSRGLDPPRRWLGSSSQRRGTTVAAAPVRGPPPLPVGRAAARGTGHRRAPRARKHPRSAPRRADGGNGGRIPHDVPRSPSTKPPAASRRRPNIPAKYRGPRRRGPPGRSCAPRRTTVRPEPTGSTPGLIRSPPALPACYPRRSPRRGVPSCTTSTTTASSRTG